MACRVPVLFIVLVAFPSLLLSASEVLKVLPAKLRLPRVLLGFFASPLNPSFFGAVFKAAYLAIRLVTSGLFSSPTLDSLHVPLRIWIQYEWTPFGTDPSSPVPSFCPLCFCFPRRCFL